jgi:hypothetical protein
MAKQRPTAEILPAANPPRPNRLLLALSVLAWFAWLGFLIWLAWQAR